APEIRICYELAEPLCHSLNRPLLLYVALVGQWRFSLNTEKLTATMRIAERVYSLAENRITLRSKGEPTTFRSDPLPFGRFPGRTRIRHARLSDLAPGKRTGSCRRLKAENRRANRIDRPRTDVCCTWRRQVPSASLLTYPTRRHGWTGR